MLVIGRADGLPVFRPVGLQAFLQPARMCRVQYRVAVQLGEQHLMVALGIAQHAIEQTLERGFLQLVDTGHRLTDGGMRGDTGMQQLIQTDQ